MMEPCAFTTATALQVRRTGQQVKLSEAAWEAALQQWMGVMSSEGKAVAAGARVAGMGSVQQTTNTPCNINRWQKRQAKHT